MMYNAWKLSSTHIETLRAIAYYTHIIGTCNIYVDVHIMSNSLQNSNFKKVYIYE